MRALFGPYAAGFDEHLVENLKYRGHEAVVDAALAARPASADASAPRFDQVLDLGCGTGLCGRRLQGHARHIEGIDLSPSMLQAARASGAYDTLTLGEVVESLHASPRRLDLVLAADVFIYIGSLDELFSALSAQLQAGALVAFSVETMSPEELTADVNGTGWCLRRSLRYAHSQAYLEGLCAANGWKWLAWQALVLREEERQAIEGAAVVMQA